MSILVMRVLNLDLPSLAPSRTGNFLSSNAKKKSGIMIEKTKKAYEKKVATFLTVDEFLPSKIFIIEKKVKSK